MKNKLAMKATGCVLLDIFALVVMGYIAMNTMNIVMWTFLLLLCLIISYDISRAVVFIKNILKK